MTIVYDKWGIKEIYKTKQNEISWFLNDTASNPDLTIHNLNSKITKQTDRGFEYFTASVNTINTRFGNISIPSFRFEIRASGELPGTQKYNFQSGVKDSGYLYSENDIGDAEFTFVARRRTIRANTPLRFECRGGDRNLSADISSMVIQYPTTPQIVNSSSNEIFQKELIDSIVDTITSRVKVNTLGWPADTWMAFKAVTYVMVGDKSQVINRLYYDNDPIDFTQSPPKFRNNWVLVSEFIDRVGSDTGNYNTCVNWRGCTWTVRIDNTDFVDFAAVSLRSIEPLPNEDVSPGFTGGSGGLGGGDTTGVIDPFEFIGGSLGTSVTGQTDTSIVLAPALSNNFIDIGGPLINKVDVYYLYWGVEWTTQTAPYSKAQLDTAIQTVFGSPYFDSLIEYRKVKRPVNKGSVINSTFPKVDQYDEIDAKNFIDNCKSKGLIPSTVSPDVTLFVIITPNNFYRVSPGIRGYTFGSSAKGTYSFAFVDFQSTLTAQTTSMIGVVADFMVNNNPSGTQRGFVTNPNGDFGNVVNASITDVCGATSIVSGITVPRYWSNILNGCIAPTTYPPFVSCVSGSVWDPIGQVCNIDTGGGEGDGDGDGSGPPVIPPPIVFVPSILDSPKGGETVDKGGYIPVQTYVYIIFWGNYWNSGTPLTTKNSIISAMNALFSSKYFDHIYQYRKIKRPFLQDIPTNITYDTINNYTATNVTALIDDCKANNQIATNFDPTNSFFIIMNPSGIIKSGSTSSGVTSFDHYKNTYYWGFINSQSSLALYTQTLSNLIVNTATDPEPPTGIVLKPNSTKFPGHGLGTDELTEICSTIADVVGVSVRRYWSDQENVCIAKDLPPTWLHCPSGSTWNPIIQECVVDVVATPTPIPGDGDTGSGGGIGGVDTSQPGKYANSILANPKTRIIKYNGGPIPNPLQIAFIFWGDEWNEPETQSGLTKDQIMIAVDTIFRSNYFTYLYQYRKIKKPQLLGSVVNTTFLPVENYKHSDVVAFVKDSIDHQLVPFNNSTEAMSNTIAHFVISPTSVYYSGPPASNGSFYAAGHGWEEVNSGVSTPYHILGWAIAAPKDKGYDLADQTEWISKMLLGMVTDPKPHTGIVTSIVGSGNPLSNPPAQALALRALQKISSSMGFTRNDLWKPQENTTDYTNIQEKRFFKPEYFSLEDNDNITASKVMSTDNNKDYDENGEYIGPFIPGKKRRHPLKDAIIHLPENGKLNFNPDFMNLVSNNSDNKDRKLTKDKVYKTNKKVGRL
jgi:hypothetical protein